MKLNPNNKHMNVRQINLPLINYLHWMLIRILSNPAHFLRATSNVLQVKLVLTLVLSTASCSMTGIIGILGMTSFGLWVGEMTIKGAKTAPFQIGIL